MTPAGKSSPHLRTGAWLIHSWSPSSSISVPAQPGDHSIDTATTEPRLAPFRSTRRHAHARVTVAAASLPIKRRPIHALRSSGVRNVRTRSSRTPATRPLSSRAPPLLRALPRYGRAPVIELRRVARALGCTLGARTSLRQARAGRYVTCRSVTFLPPGARCRVDTGAHLPSPVERPRAGPAPPVTSLPVPCCGSAVPVPTLCMCLWVAHARRAIPVGPCSALQAAAL